VVLFHAAINPGGFYPGIPANFFEYFGYLLRQFVGWRHYQAPDSKGAIRFFCHLYFVDDRDGKCRCFSRSGLCNSQYVLTFQNGRNGFELDVGWPAEPFFFQVFFDLKRNGIFLKLHVFSVSGGKDSRFDEQK
jgi:hypothetical protein